MRGIPVFQPVGADTPLSIAAPDWADNSVEACRCNVSLIAPVETTLDGGELLFIYAGTIQGEQVGCYRSAPRRIRERPYPYGCAILVKIGQSRVSFYSQPLYSSYVRIAIFVISGCAS
jgi:hypothetical protein